MNIQTLSIVVPTKGCVNKCKGCVSRMHGNEYENCFDAFQIKKRIKYAVNNNINTCIITGTGEALQNINFLSNLEKIFKEMDHPFPNVEFQTSGVMLMEKTERIHEITNKIITRFPNIELLKRLGVNTISLSIWDIFDSNNNSEIINVSEKLRFNINDLCFFIKQQGFNLRLSLNMTDVYDNKTIHEILRRCKGLLADQVTFRKLYYSGYDNDSEQSLWVRKNACVDSVFVNIIKYIKGTPIYDKKTKKKEFTGGEGKALYKLPFGATVYSITGMSTVIDDNCMSKNESEKLKYIILRENGKLYSQWDDEGSLIF
jgi:hypothetical protein